MDIKSMTLAELTAALAELSEPAYRAKQLYAWMHVRLATTYEEMTNLPKSLREKLAERYPLTVLTKAVRLDSKLDGTKKYLFRLPDGNVIESVRMEYHHGVSVCISSQVGCRMGCTFCASTIGGLVRNLTPSEMAEQIYAITRDTGERVSNIVVMGTGEPLDNYDNLLAFLRIITDENGLHISQRNVTISTCGLVPKLRSLADLKLAVTPAISLHAPNDELRSQLMPVNRRWPLDVLLRACAAYTAATKRIITFEYTVVAGVNDSRACAEELARQVRRVPMAKVNLIPLSPVAHRPDFRTPDESTMLMFLDVLMKRGVQTMLRRSRGKDANAACGQLRLRRAAAPREAAP